MLHADNDGEPKAIRVRRNGFLMYCFAFFGESGDRAVAVELERGAQAYVYGIFFGNASERLCIKTMTRHLEEDTFARTSIRGVLSGRAHTDFSGLIQIDKSAQRTNSYLDERVLLLSDKATSLARPELEIEADDVKASHSATAGTIHPEQLFYLNARGINKTLAQSLIAGGFLKAVASLIEDEDIKKQIFTRIEKMNIA